MSAILTLLENDIWTVESSHRFLGIDFGARMTVIRLKSGDLILHSPVLIDGSVKDELIKIGSVKYIVAPNKFHHLNIKQCASTFPEARVYGAPGLSTKRKDINFDGELGEDIPEQWMGEVDCLLFEGAPIQNEVVFFHQKSKTIIFTDLIFNFENQDSIGVKIFARLDGIYQKPDVPRVIRWFMLKDRDKARNSVEKILSWDFDRVSLTHKDIIESGGKEIVRKAFESI